jgi:DNA-binding ferritin-like protein
MKNTATILRTMQLVAHNYHNLIAGQNFFADHEFLGELYPAYESAYDSVIERCIGLHDYGQKEIDIVSLEARNNSAELPYSSAAQCFQNLLSAEKVLCATIVEDMQKATEGTKNLLAQLADDSEVRQYKLQRRIKK